jgi:Arylsulfotransferase (ASST)
MVQMEGSEPTITRRRFLRRAGVGALGLAASGGITAAVVEAVAGRQPRPPVVPRWRSRPDLRIPALTVTRAESAASHDPIFIAPYNVVGAQAGAVIADASGEPIWENPLAGKVTTNFRVQRYRGSPVLTWWEGSIELGHGVGEYVIADSSYRTVRRVQAGNRLRGDLHEFVITPRDTALLTSYVVTKADLSSVGGSHDGTIQDAVFQEIDLASGEVLIEWHSLGSVPLTESYAEVTADWDFFHINSVDLDWDGNLLVSSRSMHTVYKLDRRSGAILWRLGGKRSDFAMGGGTHFAWQHDVRRRADGSVTIFDNGATPAVERRSRALILALDEQAMKASLIAEYAHAKVLAGSQGSVQLHRDGNVFVGWGEVPRVTEFDHRGRIVFDALLGSRYQSYRAFRLPWTGMPSEAPAIALGGPSEQPTVYASWNGATEVARWQLLAGARSGALRPVSSAPARGFETALHSHGRGPRFAVRALDRHGLVLGSSGEAAVAA